MRIEAIFYVSTWSWRCIADRYCRKFIQLDYWRNDPFWLNWQHRSGLYCINYTAKKTEVDKFWKTKLKRIDLKVWLDLECKKESTWILTWSSNVIQGQQSVSDLIRFLKFWINRSKPYNNILGKHFSDGKPLLDRHHYSLILVHAKCSSNLYCSDLKYSTLEDT